MTTEKNYIHNLKNSCSKQLIFFVTRWTPPRKKEFILGRLPIKCLSDEFDHKLEQLKNNLVHLRGQSDLLMRLWKARSLTIKPSLYLLLECCDNETDQMNQLLYKLCYIKTGFMQDLLTGKKRVIASLNEEEVKSYEPGQIYTR